MSILQSDITSEQPVFTIYYDFFLKFLYMYFLFCLKMCIFAKLI